MKTRSSRSKEEKKRERERGAKKKSGDVTSFLTQRHTASI